MGGIVKKQRQKMMRPVLLREEGDQTPLQNSKVTSTPNKHWKASASCLMGMEWGMWLPSFLYFQPNKVKSGQYQQNNTYNKLIEPDKWQSNSDLNNMTNLLKLLTTKNIKAKLGKGTAMQGSKTPSHSLFLIRGIIQIMETLQEPLKLLIQWKTQKNQLSRSIPWSTLRHWIVMGQ